jgi:endoglucanase
MNFATPEANDIWKRDDLQKRFSAIWTRLSLHFGDSDPDYLAFELLNEPTANDNEDWNRVATVGYEAIRAASKARTIFVGSNSWQSPFTFPALKVFQDPAVVYAFHFYEPFIFTHQKASWVKHLKILDMAVEYPSVVPDLSTEAAALPTEQMREQTMIYSGQSLDKTRLLRTLGNVLDFMKTNNAEAYCSEFGVYSKASAASTFNWFRDIVDIFKSKGIGWSVWDYKGGFAVFEKDGTVKPQGEILFHR